MVIFRKTLEFNFYLDKICFFPQEGKLKNKEEENLLRTVCFTMVKTSSDVTIDHGEHCLYILHS